MKLFKYFLGLKQIQKILQNTTGCHFPKNLVFGSLNDSLVVAWVSPCTHTYINMIFQGQYLNESVSAKLSPWESAGPLTSITGNTTWPLYGARPVSPTSHSNITTTTQEQQRLSIQQTCVSNTSLAIMYTLIIKQTNV